MGALGESLSQGDRELLYELLDLVEVDSHVAQAAAAAFRKGFRDFDTLATLQNALRTAGYDYEESWLAAFQNIREAANPLERDVGREAHRRITAVQDYLAWLCTRCPAALQRILEATAWENSLSTLHNSLLYHAEVLPSGEADPTAVQYPDRLRVARAYDWLCCEYGVERQRGHIQRYARRLLGL